MLVYLYKMLLLNKKINYFLAGAIRNFSKSRNNILNVFGIFPEKLVDNLQTAMGLTQLITASLGVVIVYCTVYINNKRILKNK